MEGEVGKRGEEDEDLGQYILSLWWRTFLGDDNITKSLVTNFKGASVSQNTME